MTVTIAGGHGKVARRLARLLVTRGVHVRALLPSEEHADGLRDQGAEPVVCDVEQAPVDEVAAAIERSDAVVYVAVTGSRNGAVTLLEATRAAFVRRYVMLSRVEDEADRALQASDREWTIVRPDLLTDGPSRGRVYISDEPLHGPVSRYDVAATLAAVLDEPRSIGWTLYVIGGQDPVEWALVAALTRPRRPAAQVGLRLL